MVETIPEFQEELRAIREDMKKKGWYADSKMVASWLDRLIIAMEQIAPTLDLMGEEIDQVSESEACSCETCDCCSGEQMVSQAKAPAKAKPKAKKATKKRK